MIEYLPWSKTVFDDSLKLYKNGIFSIVDLEIGGHCNLSCIYCDSPERKIESKIIPDELERLFLNKNLKWLFVCGLGEPLHNKNKGNLLVLLNFCEKYNVRCSLFSNLLNLSENVLYYIEKGILNILFKLDSMDESLINKLYNTNKGKIILNNINKLIHCVKTQNNLTNIGASIVPTKVNYREIPNIVNFCTEHKIFPLIGVLEHAGSAIKVYNKLSLSRNELDILKKEISDILNEEYFIPICPAVISGIHINHENKIIVDESTGLSCHWFWLKTPKIHEICSLDSVITWEKISKMIIDYRKSKIVEIKQIIDEVDELPIGGCGGNTSFLLNKYLEL